MKTLLTIVAIALGLHLFPRPALADTAGDLELLRSRYQRWVLSDDRDEASALSEKRRAEAVEEAKRALKAFAKIDLAARTTLYDTRQRGPDDAEVRELVTHTLPALSIAYQLPGSSTTPNPFYHAEAIKRTVFAAFDRLHARGFRRPMHLPWKPQHVKKRDPSQAIVVDFILRTSGYALATFLMRDELRATQRLDKALATCWEIESHADKTGDLRALFLQADAVRVVLNLSLPAALAEGNHDRLKLLKSQLDRSLAPDCDSFDTIKPDGLGHHHHGAYLGGYAAYTMAQAAFATWLLQGTAYACADETIGHVSRGLATLRLVAQKYDMHRSLSGRLVPISVIPSVMLGYAYLADLPHARQREFQGIFARLADDAFLASDETEKTFSGHRDEVPPGPGAVAFFFRALASARKVGAENDPQGHWSFNYGPIDVHRRDGWMAAIKGYSRYWWAFERSIVDARKDPRMENVFGFHVSSGSLMIFSRGHPWVNARESGYEKGGWDWCHVPGTTTRYFSSRQLQQLATAATNYNRPKSDATFVGGLSHEGNGLFVLDYREAASDQRETPLRALKSTFFFNDQIVMLGTGIEQGDGIHPVTTTLFQTALATPATPTFAQGKELVDLSEHSFAAQGARLVDAAGNGYYVPAGQNVTLSRKNQTHLDEKGKREVSGYFSTAWIEHGVSPSNASYHYVVLVRSGPEGLRSFAAKAAQEYSIRRQDDVAHIVAHHRLHQTGYAVIQGGKELGDAFVRSTSAPCLLMVTNLAPDRVNVSVCNPDLGWKDGERYNTSKSPIRNEAPLPPVPMPVSVTLNGHWQLPEPARDARTEIVGATTLLHVACADARTIAFRLQRLAR